MQGREYLMSSALGNTKRFLAPWGMRVGAGQVGAAPFQGSWTCLENSSFQWCCDRVCPTLETYWVFIVRAK